MPLDEQQVKKIQELINQRNILNLSVNNSFSKLAYILGSNHESCMRACIEHACIEHRENIDRLQQELEQYDCQINELITSILN